VTEGFSIEFNFFHTPHLNINSQLLTLKTIDVIILTSYAYNFKGIKFCL